LAQCDYWWFAGGTQMCDLSGTCCKCGGSEDSCALGKKREKIDKHTHFHLKGEPRVRERMSRHSEFHR
jgi:hypothetical protein